MNGPWRKSSFEKLWGINGSRELHSSFSSSLELSRWETRCQPKQKLFEFSKKKKQIFIYLKWNFVNSSEAIRNRNSPETCRDNAAAVFFDAKIWAISLIR